MTKAVLKYDLKDPDEKQAFECAIKSMDLAMFVFNVMHNIPKRVEWAVEQNEFTAMETIEFYNEQINMELNHFGIDIDNLIQ